MFPTKNIKATQSSLKIHQQYPSEIKMYKDPWALKPRLASRNYLEQKSKQGFLQSRFQHLSSSSSDWAAAWSLKLLQCSTSCSGRPKRHHKVLMGFCLETSWWVGLMDADGRSWWSRFTPRSVPVLTSEQDNINKSWKLEWVSGEGGGCGEESLDIPALTFALRNTIQVKINVWVPELRKFRKIPTTKT